MGEGAEIRVPAKRWLWPLPAALGALSDLGAWGYETLSPPCLPPYSDAAEC